MFKAKIQPIEGCRYLLKKKKFKKGQIQTQFTTGWKRQIHGTNRATSVFSEVRVTPSVFFRLAF